MEQMSVRVSATLLLVYFFAGTLFLPQGNFSALEDIPAMYHHCKATEDKDMTPIDFITDHLINIDGLFDKHDNGDEQKPHTPIQLHHLFAQTIFVIQQFKISFQSPTTKKDQSLIYQEQFYLADFSPFVFRPPIG